VSRSLWGGLGRTKISLFFLKTRTWASLIGLIQPMIGYQVSLSHLGHFGLPSKISSQSRHNLAILRSMALGSFYSIRFSSILDASESVSYVGVALLAPF
jgi:hypothetical protein